MLGSVLRKGTDGSGKPVKNLTGTLAGKVLEFPAEPIRAEFLPLGIQGLRDPVGVEKDQVTVFESEGIVGADPVEDAPRRRCRQPFPWD